MTISNEQLVPVERPSVIVKAIAAAVVLEACESDPADPDHPDTLMITTEDLEAIVRSNVEAALERLAALRTPPATDALHPSHKIRSSDASTFDFICEACACTDEVPGGWGQLVKPCRAPPAIRSAASGEQG